MKNYSDLYYRYYYILLIKYGKKCKNNSIIEYDILNFFKRGNCKNLFSEKTLIDIIVLIKDGVI